MSLGKQIQHYRKRKGLSQEQLASKLNVSRQALSKWESDINVPSIDKIVDVAKELDVSVNDLLGLESDSNSDYDKLESILNQVVLTQNNEIERNKRNLNLVFIIGIILFVVIILSLGIVFVKVRDLKNSNVKLVYQFSNINDQITAFQDSISEQMIQNNYLISSHDFRVEDVDFDNKTMKAKIDVVVKNYENNSNGQIVLDYEHYDDQTYELTYNNGHYQLLENLPIDNIPAATITIGDDNKQTQEINYFAPNILDGLKMENIYLEEHNFSKTDIIGMYYYISEDYFNDDNYLNKFCRNNKITKISGFYQVNGGKKKKLKIKIDKNSKISFEMKNIKDGDDISISIDYKDKTGFTYHVEKNYEAILQANIKMMITK